MKHANSVRAQKVSTGLRGGILTLLSCSAFACTPVSVEPIGSGGSAGVVGTGGSSGAVGQGGTGGGNLGHGGNAGVAGIGGTGGVGGSSGMGGTSNGTGGTGGTGLLPDGGDPGPINLIANSDFEQGLAPWTMIAQAGTIMLSTDCNGPMDPDAGVPDAGETDAGEPERPHGLQCGRGTNRTLAFHGPAYPLNGILTTRGKMYTVSAYGRIANASSSVIKLTMRTICQGHDGIGLPPLYANLTTDTPVTDREWIFLSNEFTVPDTGVCPVMTDIRLYLEGPPAGVDILVDDVSIYEL